MTLIAEEVKELTKFLSVVQGNSCIFCSEILEGETLSGSVAWGLPICNVCRSKYELLRKENFGTKLKPNQKEILEKWFSCRCFFCEKELVLNNEGRNTETEIEILLCSSSCLPRYKVLMSWEEAMKDNEWNIPS